MKKLFFLLVLFCLALGGNLFAVGLDFTEVGLRSNGMGNAYTGVADDASAVYWNPAGLTQIGDGAINGEQYTQYIDPTFKYKDTSDKTYKSSESVIIPAGFLAYKKGDFAVGMGLYVPFATGSLEFKDVPQVYPGPVVLATDVKATLGYYALGVSTAYRIMPFLSVGITGEAIYGDMEIKIRSALAGVTQKMKYSGLAGYRGAIGLMVEPSADLNIGLQLKSKTTLKMDGSFYSEVVIPPSIESDHNSEYKQKLPFFLLCGIGYNVNQDLLVSFDGAYRWWSKADQKTVTTNGSKNQQASDALSTDWNNNYSVSFGFEYKLLPDLKIRNGMWYIKGCVDDNDVTYMNITDTSVMSYRLGVAYNILPNLELAANFAYVYGFEVENDYGKYSNTSWGGTLGVRFNFE